MNISKRTIFSSIFLSAMAFLLAVLSTPLVAKDSDKRYTRAEYIEKYKHIAVDHQKRYGIPASITMAQGILESDNGNSILARGSNNHFGIKCKSHWKGRTFIHTDDEPDECFRAYDSVEDSYRDHAEFLDSSPRYDSLFNFAPTDYKSWARALKNAGYATAPTYTSMLIKLIEDNDLHQLDIIAAEGEERGGQYATLYDFNKDERAQKGTSSINPNEFRTSVKPFRGYEIYRTNKTFYILAKQGDSYASVAKKFSITTNALCRFNDIDDKESELKMFDVIYIERKQSYWGGKDRVHTTRRGETLHEIAQSYGIRESVLRRLNNINIGDKIEAGQSIKLK